MSKLGLNRPVSLFPSSLYILSCVILTASQPCRRCQREARECILGESHRGGRRVRKNPKEDGALLESPSHPQAGFPSSSNHTPLFSPHAGPLHPAPANPFSSQYAPREDQESRYPWQLPTPTNTSGSDSRNGPRYNDQHNVSR